MTNAEKLLKINEEKRAILMAMETKVFEGTNKIYLDPNTPKNLYWRELQDDLNVILEMHNKQLLLEQRAITAEIRVEKFRKERDKRG